MPDAQLSKIFDININWFPKELWIGNKNSFTLYTLNTLKKYRQIKATYATLSKHFTLPLTFDKNFVKTTFF